MALIDKTRCETNTEAQIAEEECQLNRNKGNINKEAIKVQLLAIDEELFDSDTEFLSTNDSNCAINSISEDYKSILDSPPYGIPYLPAYYETPHFQMHTAEQQKKKEDEEVSSGSSFLPEEKNVRQVPAAIQKWPDCVEVWLNMLYKEEATLRTRNARNAIVSSPLLPRMRAILVDWIMEVAEVYQLRRNTYYLALDYIDRYLVYNSNIPKTQLQMLGITCLFIAAKLEEICPPTLTEFIYVCDGACTEIQMLSCERVVFNALNWNVNPMTPTSWLNLYMQIDATPSVIPPQLQEESYSYLDIYYPTYSAYDFMRANNVIDLFSFDPSYSRFNYNIIAAAAMYWVLGDKVALNASGLVQNHIDLCLAHMLSFHEVLSSAGNPRPQSVLDNGGGGACSTGIPHGVAFMPMDRTYPLAMNAIGTVDNNQLASYQCIQAAVPNLIRDENHLMQTHCIDMDCYERAVVLRLEWLGFRAKKVYGKQRKPKPSDPSTATAPPTSNPYKSCKFDYNSNLNCNNASDAGEEYVQVPHADENGGENNDNEEDSDLTSAIIMYEIERKPFDTDFEGVDSFKHAQPQKNATEPATSSNAGGVTESYETNIFTLEAGETKLISLEEILISVHRDCTDDMVLSLWEHYKNNIKKENSLTADIQGDTSEAIV